MENDYLKSPAFYTINRGKLSVVLDFAKEAELEAFHKILSQADVFLSNFRQKGEPQYLEI